MLGINNLKTMMLQVAIKNKHMRYKLSLITTAILLITSFIPVLQVVLITINGGLVGLITLKNFMFQYVINSLGSILFLGTYYLFKDKKMQIFSIIGFLFFFFPLISYLTEKTIPQDPYFLGMMLIGMLSGILLLAVDSIRKGNG